MAQLGQFILDVKDVKASMAFYPQLLGFAAEGKDGPFTVVRVNPAVILLISPRTPQATEHFAFALPHREVQDVITRVKAAGLAYGPSCDTVGAPTGPAEEVGAYAVFP